MKIGIANDHGGYELKTKIVKYLQKKGHEVIDIGCTSEKPVDYPIYAFELGERLKNEEFTLGIAICKSGIGVSIACNKVKGIRCAKPANAKESRLSREHNDANVLALSADMPYYRVLDIIDTFLVTPFTREDRHQRRIDLITAYETKKTSTKKTITNQKELEEKENEC